MQAKQKRRAKLLEAGLQVFFEKGFEKTTIDDIVRRAECGKGTFYNYFKNKDEMVDALDAKFKEKMAEKLATECPYTLKPSEFFKKLLLTLKQSYKENYRINVIKLSRVYTKNNFFDNHKQVPVLEVDYTVTYIKEKKEKGEIEAVDIRAIEACLIGSAYHMRYAELIQKKPYTEKEIDSIVKIILNGVKNYE